MFPNVPVSFCGVNGLNDEELKKLSGSTGVIEVFEARKTLELALGLHPKTKEVFIINDYLKTGRAWELAMRKQLIGLEKRVRLTFAENLAMKDLQEKNIDSRTRHFDTARCVFCRPGWALFDL